MQSEVPQLDVAVTHWKLNKFEVDPVTGERTLIETIEGGDDRPTETTFRKEEK